MQVVIKASNVLVLVFASGLIPFLRNCYISLLSHHSVGSQILPPDDPVNKLSDQYWKIRADEVPKEELRAGPHDRLLHVYHFRQDKLNEDQVSCCAPGL
jgi:hypothetical protein